MVSQYLDNVEMQVNIVYDITGLYECVYVKMVALYISSKIQLFSFSVPQLL